jgi:hypothetical protein
LLLSTEDAQVGPLFNILPTYIIISHTNYRYSWWSNMVVKNKIKLGDIYYS